MGAATANVAAFAAGDDVPSQEHDAVFTQALIDTIAVSVAARGHRGELLLREWAAQEWNTSGRSTVWTTGERTTAAWAALLNGNAAHVLDYDDISPSTPIHPSAVLLPALLAVAEERDLAPGRLVEAYDVGAAVFRALAEALPAGEHYARGWHTTATVGRLAATAAIARLARTSAETVGHALGIASTLSGGSRANFGTMTKPFHAGLAARDAVTALQLAESGFTANAEELEAEGGFIQRLGDVSSPDGPARVQRLATRLSHWLDAWPTDWGLKQYPACYATHRAIGAATNLRRAQSLPDLSTVDVCVWVNAAGTTPLRSAPPTSPSEARFSMEYCVASALLHGGVGLADFTPEGFGRREVRDLASRVTVAESETAPIGSPEFEGGFAVVVVNGPDGTLCERVDITRGDGRNPLTTAELRAKFDDCWRAGGGATVEDDELFSAAATLVRSDSLSALSEALRRHGRDGGADTLIREERR